MRFRPRSEIPKSAGCAGKALAFNMLSVLKLLWGMKVIKMLKPAVIYRLFVEGCSTDVLSSFVLPHLLLDDADDCFRAGGAPVG